MKRKELKKAVMAYSHEINFHKLGLIRQLVQLKEKRNNYLLSKIPKVVCPHCNSTLVEITSSDSEYSDAKWLYCRVCGESFDDSFGLIDATEDLSLEPYFDTIRFELDLYANSSIKPKIFSSSSTWNSFCEEAIRGMLAQGLF